MTTAAQTILLKGRDELRIDHRTGDGSVKPGHLVYLKSTDKVAVHATSGGDTALWVAIEDAYQGKTIDDTYADGDTVFFAKLLPGNEAALIVKSGETIVIGDALISNGDGTLVKWTAPTNALSGNSETITITTKKKLFMALESSGGALGADTRMRVEAL